MATINNRQVFVDLRQNNNEKSDQFGKLYPSIRRLKTLSLRGLAKHISDHGSVFTRPTIEGVLAQLCECIPELLSQGQPVKLDGLGTFYVNCEAKPGGLDDIEAAKATSPAAVIEGVHIRFTPEGEELDRITSRAFMEKVSFSWGNLVEITGYKDAVKKQGPIYKLTPISNPLVDDGDDEPEP